jgi:hypothetical protein
LKKWLTLMFSGPLKNLVDLNDWRPLQVPFSICNGSIADLPHSVGNIRWILSQNHRSWWPDYVRFNRWQSLFPCHQTVDSFSGCLDHFWKFPNKSTF